MTKPIELTAQAVIHCDYSFGYGWTLAVYRRRRRCGTYYSVDVFKRRTGAIRNALEATKHVK